MQDLHHSAISALTQLFDELEVARQHEVRVEVVEAEADFEGTTRCLLPDSKWMLLLLFFIDSIRVFLCRLLHFLIEGEESSLSVHAGTDVR